MKKTLTINQLQKGISLPITILFSFICSGLLFSYILNVYEKDWHLQYKIAETKAMYNAESGIALSAYSKLYKKDYIPASTDTIKNIDIKGMGSYSIGLFEGIDTATYKPMRGANSTGYSTVKHALTNKEITIERKKILNLGHKGSLSDFLYLTDSELAGGHPWSFDSTPSYDSRREVNWGGNDNLNGGWNGDPICDVGFKTNGTFIMSSYGSPQFDITVTVVENDGEVNDPDMNGQNPNWVFQGEPALDTTAATCLPPPGYETMKRVIENSNDHITLDATQKLKWQSNFNFRDTLIMTDIEFFVEGENHGFRVKQWWYLMPPYLKDLFNGFESPYISSAAAIGNSNAECDPITQTAPSFDIRGCENYIEHLEDFHSRTVDLTDGSDAFVNPDYFGIVSGTYGFHHYDVPEIYANGGWKSQTDNAGEGNINDLIDAAPPFGMNFPDHLLVEYIPSGGYKTYNYSGPTAIYVKGGPVRVHGRYKGRYTVVTDEYTPYRRHAWGINVQGSVPIDTLWNNIWITDDLLNNDTNSAESMLFAQPDEDGNDGSENALGLVSGANVFIANTEKNGARDCNSNNNSNDNYCDINIHAHIIAFNESFATHYSQNTYSSSGQIYSNPPYGDGQGIQKYGASGSDDTRGTIHLWGGVVQKFRGYVVRNSPGPYNLPNGNIGYSGKDYNFDCNLKYSLPPLYPENTTCDESADELPWSVTGYY